MGLTLSQPGSYTLSSSAVANVNPTTLQFEQTRTAAGISATTSGVSLTSTGYISGASGVVMQSNASLTNRAGPARMSFSVETAAGVGNFADQPRFLVNPIPTSTTVAGYYNYDVIDRFFKGPGNGDFVPPLERTAANLFFVDGSDGRGFLAVLSKPRDNPGGQAGGLTAVTGGALQLIVGDDNFDCRPQGTPQCPAFDEHYIVNGVLRSTMGWRANNGDGLAIGPLGANAAVTFMLDTAVLPRTLIDRITVFGTTGQSVTLPTIRDGQRLRFTETRGGEIVGDEVGVRFAGSGALLRNESLISGGIGVDAVADLRLDGGTGAAMTGRILGTSAAGIRIGGRLTADFVNQGTVEGATDGISIGDLDGRTIRNAAGAIIRSGSGATVRFSGSGVIVNEAGAVLAGPGSQSDGIVVSGSGAVMVENAGRIDGRVSLGSGNDLMILTDAGSVGGAVDGGGGTNTLRLNAQTRNMDSAVAAAFTRFDRIEKTGAGTLVVSGMELATASTVDVFGGAMVFAGRDRLSATATMTVGVGTVDLGGWNQTVGALAGNATGTVALGSATLTVGGNNESTRFAGAISGSGGLVKIGSGAMTLSGTSSYTGATMVRAGSLVVDGSIVASSLVSVSGGALLGGNGRTGSVLVQAGGVISPGNSIGTLTVVGNFAQNGTYLAEFRAVPAGLSRGRNTLEGATLPEQDADLIHVTGTASLGGTVVLRPLSTPAQFSAAAAASPTGQVRYLILRADGGRGGTQYVALSTGSVRLEYPNANDVELVVTGPVSPIVLTNQPPVSVIARDQALWHSALTGTARLRPRCDEQGGVLSTGRCSFVQGDLGLAQRSGEPGQTGVLGQSTAGLLGAGFAVGPNLWLGAAVGVGGGSFLNTMSASASSVQTTAFLWGRWTPGDVDLRGWLGGALYDVRGARSTLLGGGAWAQYGAMQGVFAIEGRYWWAPFDRGLRLTPLVGLQTTWFTRQGYSESGGGIESFEALTQSQTSLQSLIGGELQWTGALAKMPLTLEARLGWARELQPATMAVGGVYAGDATRTMLSQTTQPMAANEVRLGLAAVLALSERMSLRLGYEGGYATDAASHGLTIRFSSAW